MIGKLISVQSHVNMFVYILIDSNITSLAEPVYVKVVMSVCEQ